MLEKEEGGRNPTIREWGPILSCRTPIFVGFLSRRLNPCFPNIFLIFFLFFNFYSWKILIIKKFINQTNPFLLFLTWKQKSVFIFYYFFKTSITTHQIFVWKEICDWFYFSKTFLCRCAVSCWSCLYNFHEISVTLTLRFISVSETSKSWTDSFPFGDFGL